MINTVAIGSSVKRWLRSYGFECHRSPERQLFRAANINVVLDVGASEGGYATELMARGYSGKIVSFEPRQDAFTALEQKSGATKNWDVCHCALGARSEVRDLHISYSGDCSSLRAVLPLSVEAAESSAAVTAEAVQVRRLDDIYWDVVSESDRVFLKVDAQGAEADVLAGAGEALKHVVGLQLELSLQPLYEGGATIELVLAELRERGFAPVWFTPGFKHPAKHQLLQVDGLFFRT